MGLKQALGIGRRSVSFAAAPSRASSPADPPWAPKALAKVASPNAEGASGVQIYTGQIFNEEPNDEVSGQRWYGSLNNIGIADEMMRTDPHIRSSIEVLIAPIVQGEWDFTIPVDAKPKSLAVMEEMAAFARWNFFELLPWRKLLRQIMDYAHHGFSTFEITTDVVEVDAERFPLHPSPVKANGMKDVLVVTGIEQRLPRTIFKWNMDKARPSRVASIEQMVTRTDTNDAARIVLNTVDPRTGAPKILRFTYDPNGNNPEGTAITRSAYGAYKIKRVLTLIDAMFHERHNLGVAELTLPKGFTKADEKKAAQIMEAIRGHESAFLVLPDGFIFKFNTSGQGPGTNIGEAIERQNRDIWMNVRATFMLLGNGDTGSYAMADSLKDVLLLDCEGHADLICTPFNVGVDGPGLAPWLLAQNYGAQTWYPLLTATNLPTRDWEKVIPQVVSCVKANVITADDGLEDQLRTVMKLRRRDPKTARKSPQELTAQAAEDRATGAGATPPDNAAAAEAP